MYKTLKKAFVVDDMRPVQYRPVITPTDVITPEKQGREYARFLYAAGLKTAHICELSDYENSNNWKFRINFYGELYRLNTGTDYCQTGRYSVHPHYIHRIEFYRELLRAMGYEFIRTDPIE